MELKEFANLIDGRQTFVIYEDDEPYCRGFVFRV
mgnify:CR=1 FL=1